jgi:transcriptional regulator with XRE-family HTH domain
MTINELSKTIIKLRKEKDLFQNDVADKMKMPRSTYALKEKKGDFEEEEINNLSRILGAKDVLITLWKKQIRIDDPMEFLIKSAINNNATQRVVLMTLAELLSKQKGKSLNDVLRDLTKAVEAEKALHPMR